MKSNGYQQGWGLVETLLTLGTISALSVGIYMTFAPTDATAKTKAEQENIREFVERVGNAYGLLNNYSEVSNNNLISDKVLPSIFLSRGELLSSWSSPIVLAPYQVNQPNDSFVINYQNTPKEVCNRLASAGSNGAYDVLVNGTSVLTSSRSLNPISTAALCEEGSELSFVFTGYGNMAYAADPLDLPPSPNSVTPSLNTPVTNVVVDPTDVDNALTSPPVVTDPGTGVTPPSSPPLLPTSPTPSTPISPTVPPPVVTIPAITACSVPASDFQNVNTCSAGAFGQFRQQRDYSCPEAWDAPSVTAWYNISNTCTSCPPNFNENRRQWMAYTALMCAAGQYGYTNREQEQSSDRTGSYVCPYGTQTLPAPTYTGWTAWSNTATTRHVSDVCTNCPSPSTGSQTQWVGYTAAMCAAGQYGLTNRELEQSQSRSITYNCPAGTATLPAPIYGSWGSWANTGNTRAVNNGTCANCPAGGTESATQWVSYTAAMCAAGQYGLTNREQEQSRNRGYSYNCPAGTTAIPAPTYAGWSVWANTGNTRAVNNGTCANCPAGGTESATQWVGYTAAMCASGQYGYTNREQEQSRNRSYSYNCPVGTTTIPAPTYAGWSGWSNTGTTRAVNNGTCTNCPAGGTEYNTQWVGYTAALCPAGQYGLTNREQEQSRNRSYSYNCPTGTTAIPAPTYAGWSGWSNTGTTRAVNNGTCANCPAPFNESNYRWENRSAACPSGQVGSNTWQAQQVQYRSVSWNCPTGTASLPAASYSGWGAWADTGTIQSQSNTCVPSTPVTPITHTCQIKGPGSVESEKKKGCDVTVRLKGESGVVTARFILSADPSAYNIVWSGDCTGTGATCVNSSSSTSWGRPYRDYDVYWTATHIATGTVQSGNITASYGEK